MIEVSKSCGIEIKRLFYIKVDRPGVVRAEHAVSEVAIIVALTGAVTIDFDNGFEQDTLVLSSLDTAIVVDAGVWLRLRDFVPTTILMVGSTNSYSETITRPVPFWPCPH